MGSPGAPAGSRGAEPPPRGSRIGPGTGALLERGPWQRAVFVLGRVAMNRAASASSTKSLYFILFYFFKFFFLGGQSRLRKPPGARARRCGWTRPRCGAPGARGRFCSSCPAMPCTALQCPTCRSWPHAGGPGTPMQQVVPAGPAPSSASGAPEPLQPAATIENVSGLTLGVPGSALPAQASSSCLTAGEL